MPEATTSAIGLTGTRWGCFCTIAEFKWKNSYGRGWGESMICNPGGDKPEYDAGLCYPRCGNNYRGVSSKTRT